jgi:hypothetical protein
MNRFIWFILRFPTCFCFSIVSFPYRFQLYSLTTMTHFTQHFDKRFPILHWQRCHTPIQGMSLSLPCSIARNSTGLFPPTDRFLAHWPHLPLFT